MVDLFELAARITADTAQHDRALTESQKKVLALAEEYKHLDKAVDSSGKSTTSAALSMEKQLAAVASLQRQRSAALIAEWKKQEQATAAAGTALKNLASGATAVQGPLGGVAGRLQGLSALTNRVSESFAETGTSAAGLAGPIGIAVAGVLATTVAVGLLVKGLYDVTQSTADWEGKLYDLSQQTGVSVETLNALEIAAGKTGGSIDTVVASLGIFQRKMEEADDPASKMATTFKELGVTADNTEEAFRQVLVSLSKMPEGYHQTALALEVFGRGGKSILAILKETNGDIDSAVAKLGELGAVTTEQAKAADDFGDTLKDLGTQARGAGAIVGREALPAFQSMANSLKDNEDAVILVAGALGNLSLLITGPLQGSLYTIQGAIDSVSLAWLGAYRAALLYQGVSLDMALQSDFGGGSGAFKGASAGMGGTSMFRGVTSASSGIAPSKGGTGSRNASDPFTDFLEKQKTAIAEATSNADQYQKEIDRLVLSLQKQHKALTDSQMALVQINATTLRGIEVNKQASESAKKVIEFTSQWTQQISEARGMSDQYDAAINKLIDGLKGYTVAEIAATRAALEKNAVILRTLAQTRERIALEQTLIDRLERERYVTQENWSRNFGVDMTGGDATRRRRVFGPSDEELNAEREKLRAFANDVMGLFDRAVSDAFAGSWKRAFGDVLLGFLDMMKKMEMELLAGKLAKALEASMGGGGGGGLGGFLKLLLGIGAAGLGAGIGSVGSHGAAIPHAGTGGVGGPLPHFASGINRVPYDMLAVIHKDEAVIPASQNMGGGGHTFVFNITSSNPQSFMSWETQSQITSRMRSALQKASRN